MESQITADTREFIVTAYLFGDASRLPDDDESLLETGIMDSTGVLELIEFLEDRFGIEVADSETVPENLGSIAGVTRYVSTKLGRVAGAA